MHVTKATASTYAFIMNIAKISREEYVDTCEYLLDTIKKRATRMVLDAVARHRRFVEIDISDLDDTFYDIMYEQRYDDIECVADRLFENLSEGCALTFEDEHRGLIVISW